MRLTTSWIFREPGALRFHQHDEEKSRLDGKENLPTNIEYERYAGESKERNENTNFLKKRIAVDRRPPVSGNAPETRMAIAMASIMWLAGVYQAMPRNDPNHSTATSVRRPTYQRL